MKFYDLQKKNNDNGQIMNYANGKYNTFIFIIANVSTNIYMTSTFQCRQNCYRHIERFFCNNKL